MPASYLHAAVRRRSVDTEGLLSECEDFGDAFRVVLSTDDDRD
jgi:hypothetical protein